MGGRISRESNLVRSFIRMVHIELLLLRTRVQFTSEAVIGRKSNADPSESDIKSTTTQMLAAQSSCLQKDKVLVAPGTLTVKISATGRSYSVLLNSRLFERRSLTQYPRRLVTRSVINLH